MARQYSIAEILDQLTSVEKVFKAAGTPGDTLTTAILAEDAATATVGAITNFTANDLIALIGKGGYELNGIGSAPSGTSIPLLYPAAIAQPIGARVLEMQAVDLGHTDTGGVTMTGASNATPIEAATANIPIAYRVRGGSLGGSLNLRGFNTLNLQTVFGIPEKLRGSGTAAAPWVAAITRQNVATDSLLTFRARGLMNDGETNAIVDFCGARPAPNVNATLGGSDPTVLGVQFNCTEIIVRIWK